MIKRSFVNSLPLKLKNIILDDDKSSHEADLNATNISNNSDNDNTYHSEHNEPNNSNNSGSNFDQTDKLVSFNTLILSNPKKLDLNARNFLIEKLSSLKGIIFTQFNDIQLKLFDVDSTITPFEFDKLLLNLDDNASRILLCEKIKLIYGFNSLTSFIIRLINILNFDTFFSIFDITSNIKLYGFYSLNYKNPVEILVKQIRNDLFIIKSFKEFTIQEMKKEHDFHLPYKEFKRLNLNDGNLVVVKILFKNEQKPIDLQLIKPLLPKIKMLHLSLENESKLKPFNDLIDSNGKVLNYLKFGVNRGTFKKIPIKNNINTMKLVNIDNLNFINDLKSCQSLDVFFDNWELRKNCDIKFQESFIINFEIHSRIQNLKILNIFHTYINSSDLNKLKNFPNLTHSKISYVILDDDGFDLSECKNLQELKIHFTYQKLVESYDDDYVNKIQWPVNLKKLSITIHNIKNLIQNFSIRLNILKKIAKPLPDSISDLCIDISYDTGGSGPELYSISRDDIIKISNLINKILTNNLENLKLKGISRYNYKIGKPLIFSAIDFPQSLKLLSLNDFILDYNFINLPNLKKLYFEHSLFDSDFKLPISTEILIEKCTFKDLNYLPSISSGCSKIEFKMCTFRKIPTYNGDVSNVIVNNCRVMEQPTNNIFQFSNNGTNTNGSSHHHHNGNNNRSQRKTKSAAGMHSNNNEMPSSSFRNFNEMSPSKSINQTTLNSNFFNGTPNDLDIQFANFSLGSQHQQFHNISNNTNSLPGTPNNHHLIASPPISSSGSISSSNVFNKPLMSPPLGGNFSINDHIESLYDTDAFIMSPSGSRMSINGSNASLLASHHTGNNTNLSASPNPNNASRPSSHYLGHPQQQQQQQQQHSSLVNPVLGTMNNLTNLNGISNMNLNNNLTNMNAFNNSSGFNNFNNLNGLGNMNNLGNISSMINMNYSNISSNLTPSTTGLNMNMNANRNTASNSPNFNNFNSLNNLNSIFLSNSSSQRNSFIDLDNNLYSANNGNSQNTQSSNLNPNANSN